MKRSTAGRRLAMCLSSAVLVLGAARSAWALDHGPLRRGAVELSTGASFSRTTNNGADEDPVTVLNVPVRAGYFLGDRFSLEGELLLSHLDLGEGDSQTGALASVLGLYHLGGDSRVVPFVLLGGGLGNGFEFLGVAFDADATVTSLAAGAGIKALAGEHAAFRLEYRFRKSWVSVDEFPDSTLDDHRVFAGISIFIP